MGSDQIQMHKQTCFSADKNKTSKEVVSAVLISIGQYFPRDVNMATMCPLREVIMFSSSLQCKD